MFKQRLLTALVLIPLALVSLYYANLAAFVGLTLLILVACGKEWLQLIPFPLPATLKKDQDSSTPSTGFKHIILETLFFTGLLICLILIQSFFDDWMRIGLVIWFLIFIALCTFPKSQTLWGFPLIVTALALTQLPLFAQSFIHIYQATDGKLLILYLLLLVWGADTGGYIAGKQWGRHKLIPAVSPGKTIEGIIGGATLSVLIALGAYFYLQGHSTITATHSLLGWLTMAIFVFIMALIGDLFISMLKRRVNLKDTGTLFPGHGGILDRLDSLIAAAPAFYFAIHMLP